LSGRAGRTCTLNSRIRASAKRGKHGMCGPRCRPHRRGQRAHWPLGRATPGTSRTIRPLSLRLPPDHTYTSPPRSQTREPFPPFPVAVPASHTWRESPRRSSSKRILVHTWSRSGQSSRLHEARFRRDYPRSLGIDAQDKLIVPMKFETSLRQRVVSKLCAWPALSQVSSLRCSLVAGDAGPNILFNLEDQGVLWE
jgi:hypothetical protein